MPPVRAAERLTDLQQAVRGLMQQQNQSRCKQVRAVGEGDLGDGHEVVHQLFPAVLALDVEGQVISPEMQNLRSRRYQQYRAGFRGWFV